MEVGVTDDKLYFCKSLSRENQWSDGYSQGCLCEYKKFIIWLGFSAVGYSIRPDQSGKERYSSPICHQPEVQGPLA